MTPHVLMIDNRTQNTKRNIIAGVVKQAVNIVLPFVSRTLIIYLIGAEYQGLNGLFTSILQVLNLADLGFANAVAFSLYKPIADKDNNLICALVAYLRKVYRIVAIVILAVGFSLMPFLDKIIAGDVPRNINIYVLYAIYLINTSLSYLLFAYRTTLLSALQREDVVSKITTIVSLFLKLSQIILLLLWRNYYLFVIIIPVSTVLNNLMVYYASKRVYPALVCRGTIPLAEKENLSKQIKAVCINKVGDVARNAFDNIVLSSLIGLISVAVYDNYYYIYSSVYAMMLILTSAMQASVGNSISTETIEKNYNDLLKFDFIYMIIVGWCSVFLACLYQPFMHIWMHGNEAMKLSTPNMLLFVIYFYFINMNNIRNLYLRGRGLYWECRIWYVVEAIMNLVLNFALGYLFGITGILLATIITIFVFNYVIRSIILFKHYFESSPKDFFTKHALYLAATLIICILMILVCSLVKNSGICGLLFRMSLCLIIPPFYFFTIYRNNKMFESSLQLVKAILKRRKKI